MFVGDELLGGSQQPCNGRSLGSRAGEQRFVARMEAGLGESGTSLMDSVKEGADSFLVEAARMALAAVLINPDGLARLEGERGLTGRASDEPNGDELRSAKIKA